MTALEQYLWGLHEKAHEIHPADVVLWPRTPIGDMQRQVRQFVGVGDDRPSDERSRPYRIIEYLQTIDNGGSLTVLDICCGDALIIHSIHMAFAEEITEKRIFEAWKCYGLDLLIGEMQTHKWIRKSGVGLFRATLQDLFASDPVERFDVAMMLNTYRGWESADLRVYESELPMMADRWLRLNCERAILTATTGQVRVWEARGCEVIDLGRGEQKSRLIVVVMKGG